MTLGQKFASEMPESWGGFIHDHPRAVYAVTIPLVAFAAYNLVIAVRVHMAAEDFMGRVQKAASEALGG